MVSTSTQAINTLLVFHRAAERLERGIFRRSRLSGVAYLICGAARRYTMSLEDFYVNSPGGPNITAWINGEAAQHKSYNCFIHCGGRQFCGAGVPGSRPLWLCCACLAGYLSPKSSLWEL
jgi:hypothetical protein